jgi:hypothetical protein
MDNALAALVSHLLAACSSATVSEKPQSPKEPTIEATAAPSAEPAKISSGPTRIAPRLINDWPADTPNLRDVVFDFKVIGNHEYIMPDDGSGFLIIKSERMTELVKLVFYDGMRVSYRIPIDRFEILRVGPSLTCRETAFSVPSNGGTGIEIAVEIEGGGFSDAGLEMDSYTPKSQWAYMKLSWQREEKQPGGSNSVNKFCRSDAAWAEFDGLKTGRHPTAKEIMAGIAKGAGIAVLVALKVLVTVAEVAAMFGG